MLIPRQSSGRKGFGPCTKSNTVEKMRPPAWEVLILYMPEQHNFKPEEEEVAMADGNSISANNIRQAVCPSLTILPIPWKPHAPAKGFKLAAHHNQKSEALLIISGND